MRSVETKAKTREEAIQKALNELGIELHDAEQIEIIDEGSRGIFGFGARDVHISVSTEEEPPKQKTSRPKKSGRGGRSSRPERDENRGRQSRPARGERSNRGRDRGRDRSRERNREEPRREERPPREEPRREERPPREEPRREERPPREETPPLTEADIEVLKGRGEKAAAMLKEIIDKMGIESTVQSSLTDDHTIILSVESENSAILIGRKGRNLEAMQYLINRMVDYKDDSQSPDRIVVDVEGYLGRRKTSLEDMAADLAARAKESGRNVRVKPLSPQERRIIHLALQDDPDVRTFSTGSSTYRTVVIAPRRSGGRGNDRQRTGRGNRNRGYNSQNTPSKVSRYGSDSSYDGRSSEARDDS